MFRMFPLLDPPAVERLRTLAGAAAWVDGRTSNPTNAGKTNLQLAPGDDRDEAGRIVGDALRQSAAFLESALPVRFPPPQLSLCRAGMAYAPHADNALLALPSGPIRNDVAVTVFLSDPETYEGGALIVHQGDARTGFKLPAGHAVAYAATTVHEVEPVTSGERLVAFTFVQSRIADAAERQMAVELGRIAGAERAALSAEAHARLLLIQQNLVRRWGDPPA